MYRQLFEHIEVTAQREPEVKANSVENEQKSPAKPVNSSEIVQMSKANEVKPGKISEKSSSGSASSEKENSEPLDAIGQKIFDETSRLSDRQREIIQKTFTSVEKDCVRNGLKIFVRLFAEYPRYKLIWPQFRAIPDSSLMNAVELRRHASVYLKGLGRIIESMRNEEELAKSMSRIAQAHIKWNVQRNHVIHMIEPVLEVVKECNGYQLDEETRQSWTVLYQVIANLIEIFRCRTANE
ncbi:unnamed protein product [Caenorhabditis sp. 36 PRJEB53466]|nr:unnamed protein product [Caenorhabditis sp. 36 PRJEB53466]